jgi:mRNA interferase MazF
MSTPAPRRGEVWFAEIPGEKRRPVLVLTRDPMGHLLNAVICAPITSRIRGLSTEVAIGIESGLAEESAVNLDNTFLLRRTSLRRRLGAASPAQMRAICQALAEAVACPQAAPMS